MQFDKESPPDLSNLGSSHFSINFPPFAILVISHPDEAATLPKASKGTISPPTHSFFCYFLSNQRLHTFHIWHRVLWCLWGTKVTHNPDVEMPSTFFCHDFFLEHFQFQSLIPIRGGWLANAKITRRPFIPRNCTTISWQGRRRQGWQNTDGGGIVWHQLSTQHSWFGEHSLHVLNTSHAHCSALSKRGYLYHLWYENLEKEYGH